MKPVVRRRLHQLLIALYAAALFGSLALVAGAAINDRNIEADSGRSLATVTDVGWLRTTVDFRDEEGIYRSPPTGLLYPTGLGEGQRVWVSYSASNPNLVKVEGREWTLAIIPGLSMAVVVTLVAGLLWWLVSFSTRQTIRSSEVRRE
ncbi:DUF3592 domain-containing protein [Corynebacterium alimapuense]|uniref:DUF3592 domain-containing protein n=1 Tax=Corynebacterium alimapuense TaxID=1576874 RepID=A0A3M8K845_9CORY|nr:DUF3592 domain-containing protein [Corynebacterium alimapuense]RNE48925.1 DUF3592 domain-containing protein [Corynebacterium alimapuense]